MTRLALAGNFGGITVSTMHEAAYFLENGITDMTYSVAIVPGKLDAAATLMDKGANLKIITNNAEAARAIAGHGASLRVLIEIDSGDKCGGVQPQAPELLDLARIIDGAQATSLCGVLAHAGHSYDFRYAECMAATAEMKRSVGGGGGLPACPGPSLRPSQRRVDADGPLRPGPHRRHRDPPRGLYVLRPVPGGDRHLWYRRHCPFCAQLCHRTPGG